MGDPNAPTNAGPVVICCAEADADTIRPIVDELEGQGHMVALLDGVEQSSADLASTVERLRGEGLYVLCRSKALGRGTVDELRDILLAHHIPFGRTLTVASTRPRELRERIAASLKRIAASNARRLSKVRPEGPPSKTETHVGVAPTPRPRPQFEREEPTAVRPRAARQTRIGLPPGNAPPPPPGAGKAKKQPRPTVGAAPKPPSKPSVARAEPPSPPPPDGTVGLADPEPPARLTPAIEPEGAPTEVPTSRTSSKVLIGPDDLADLDDVDLPEDLDELPTATQPVRTGNTTVSKAPPPTPPVRTGDTALVSREALLAAGLEEDPPPAPATVRTPLAPSTVKAPAASVDPPRTLVEEDDDDGAASTVPWMWIGVGGAALAVAIALVVAFTGGDDETPDDAESEIAQADDASEPADRAEDAPEGTTPESDDAAEDEAEAVAEPGPTRIGHALRTREIQALDVLLVSRTEGPVSWEDAQRHCADLELAGLDAWRLPEVGELMSLTDASMTGRGYYWSQTPADTFGDTPLVWYARRNRVVTRSRDNYVLCVRGGTNTG